MQCRLIDFKHSKFSTLTNKMFIKVIFFVSFLLNSSLAQNCDQYGICTQSIFLDRTSTTNIQECRNKCNSIFSCKFYSFDSETKECLLFEDCPKISTCPTCITNSKYCGIECDTNGLCIVSIFEKFYDGSKSLVPNSVIINMNGTVKVFKFRKLAAHVNKNGLIFIFLDQILDSLTLFIHTHMGTPFQILIEL